MTYTRAHFPAGDVVGGTDEFAIDGPRHFPDHARLEAFAAYQRAACSCVTKLAEATNGSVEHTECRPHSIIH